MMEQSRQRDRGRARRIELKGVAAVALLLTLLAPRLGFCAWYGEVGWQYRQKVTISQTVTPATLSSFPYLIKIVDAGNPLFAKAQTDGDDILFTLSDGSTKLDHEIEHYDDTGGELWAWVELTTLTTGSDTEIYLYYGNGTASNQENISGTWSNDYAAVYHLHDDFDDSVGLHNGTNSGSADADGRIADGQEFIPQGGVDKVSIGTWSVSGSQLTVQSWINADTFNQDDPRMIDKARGSGTQDHVWMLSLFNGSSGENRLRARVKTGTSDSEGTTTLIADAGSGDLSSTGLWFHVAMTYDGSTMRIVKDGADVGNTSKSGSLRENSWAISIGNNAGSSVESQYSWDGKLDEVRISTIARPLNWLTAESRNQGDPESYQSLDSEEEAKDTILGDGTDPAGATLAPGGAATMAGAFTFATSSGTDAITAVTVTLATGTASGLSLVEITNDAGSTVHGSVSNPASDTPAITLTTNITATTSSTQYKVRVTPKSHADMPAPPGAAYAVTARITDWTGTNQELGSDAAGTTVTIDNLSPGDVSSASATGDLDSVLLAWSNPGDADLGDIVVLRRAASAVTDTPAEGASYSVDDTIGSSKVVCLVTEPTANCADTDVVAQTPYYYKIFTRDDNGNYAAGVVPSGLPVPAWPEIAVSKSSAVISDPINGVSDPKRVPGSVIEFTVTTSNAGNDSPDPDTIYMTDAIDSAATEFYADGGVTFIDGATSSALTVGTVSYSSTPAPGPYVFDYSPVPDAYGYDRNITAVKVTTSGTFAYGGTPAASFSITFRVKVR